MGLSYARAQVEADYAMAMMEGPPEALDIAEAAPEDLSEIHVMAAFDPEQAVVVKIGAPGARVAYLAVPLFDAPKEVDPIGPTLTRPIARPADRARPLARATGLAVFSTDGSRPGLDAYLEPVESRTFSGAINGLSLPRGLFGLDTGAVLAESGVALAEDFVAVMPFTEGREAALAPPPADVRQRYLPWIGIAMIAFAGLLSLRPEPGSGPRAPFWKLRLVQKAAPPRSRILAEPERLNPVVGHDEIRRQAMERLHETELAQGRAPSTFLTNGSSSQVGSGWVKSRR